MTTSTAYARTNGSSANEDGMDAPNSRGRTMRFGFSATLLLACFGFVLLSACGHGGTTTTIKVQISPSATQSVDQGQSLTFTATLDNDTKTQGVTWSVSGTNCAGSGCGTLSNISTTSVTYVAPTNLSANLTVTLKATSVASSSATASVSINVVLPPSFTTTSLPNGANGVPYKETISATGGVAPLTFAMTSGSLPDGLNLNSSGTIVGTPSGSGTSNFTVTVTDRGSPPVAVSQAFSIVISPPPPLSITTTSLPPGTVNTNYSAPISSQGGVPPIKWSIVSGSLPPNLSLDARTGLISGVPTTPGTFSFTVQAQDSALPTSQVAQMPLSIGVQQPLPLQITTTALPSGETATAYPATSLQATGGVPPYTWSLTTGLLPSGLTLDSTGVISGTPILVTTENFIVQVTDSQVTPARATQSLSITITAGTNSSNTLLNGQYAFLFNGYDSDGSVAISGTFSADGKGSITAGLQDSNRISGVVSGATLTGTYSIGTDGRGTLELTAKIRTGATLTTDYQLALDSAGNARFIENDSTGTHGVGIMKKVTTPSLSSGSFSGNYAFEFSGRDFSGKPTVLGGVIHADGNQTLSPGTGDLNDAGTFSSQLSLAGAFALATGTNRGSASLTFQAPSQPQVTLQYTMYFVSPSDIFFVAIDTTDATHPRLSGEMILQQPSFAFNNAALKGTSVASGSGTNTNASVFAGLLTSPLGDGNASLTYDENDGGAITAPQPTFSGTYTVTSNGRVSFTNLGPRVAAAYLVGPAQGFLIGSDTAATAGLLEQQAAGLSFSDTTMQGDFALSAFVTADNQVTNLVGQVDSNGSGTVSGTLDEVNPSGTGNLDQPLVVLYTVGPDGRGTATTNSPTGFPTNVVFYIVSPAKVRFISVDSNSGGGHPEVIFFDH